MKVKFSISVKCFMRISNGVSPVGSASGKAEIWGAPVFASLNRKTLDRFSADGLAIVVELLLEDESMLRGLALTPPGNARTRLAATPASKTDFKNRLLLGDVSSAMGPEPATPPTSGSVLS